MNETSEDWFQAWIAFQLTNPPKTQHCLESINGGRCCLGNFCRIFMLETRIKDNGSVFYGGENGVLPPRAYNALGISPNGELTSLGKRITRIWLRENHITAFRDNLSCLSEVNDNTEATHEDIGILIKALHENGGFR